MGVSNKIKTGFICGQGTTQAEQNIFVLEDSRRSLHQNSCVAMTESSTQIQLTLKGNTSASLTESPG